MRFIGFIISAIPVIYTIYHLNRYKDLFCVQNIISVVYSLLVFIPSMLYCFDDYVELINNSIVREAVSSDGVYLMYTFLQVICFILLILGTRVKFVFHRQGQTASLNLTNEKKEDLRGNDNPLSTNVWNQNSLKKVKEEDSYLNNNSLVSSLWNQNYLIWGIFFWLIGVFAFYFIMSNVGGIGAFYSNLQYRIALTRNLDLLTIILPIANYGVLLIVYSYKGSNRKLGPGIWILAIITGLMTGLGGRKALIILLIEVLILYHYTVKPIKLKSILRLRNIWILIAIYLFFVLYRAFRSAGAMEDFLNNPLAFIFSTESNPLAILCEESYVQYYMTIIKYFSEHAFWLGSSFLGLFTSFIPSSIYALKPPVDDGMYLYSICQGRNDISPVMAASNLNGSSYPLETFGSMYANFGVIGVLLGFFILGVFLGYLYRKVKSSNFRMIYIVLYTVALFGLELSTLRIVQFIEAFVLVFVVEFFGQRIFVNRRVRKSNG